VRFSKLANTLRAIAIAADATDTAFRADLRFGPHALGDRERSLEQPVQQRTCRAGVLCRAISLLELAQDLRLANHHRVEPGGDGERMSDRARIPKVVQR
jgi:hypothetical protein